MHNTYKSNLNLSVTELLISNEEVMSTKSLKNGKSPGPDKIANNMLKNTAANTFSIPLLTLMNMCMEQKHKPSMQWSPEGCLYDYDDYGIDDADSIMFIT